MDHQAIEQEILALYDPELSEEERQPLVAHVEQCASCQQVAQRWQRIARTLAASPQPSTSEAFVRSVMERLDVSAAPVGFRRRPLVRWGLPVMAGAIAAWLVCAVVPQDDALMATEPLLLADASSPTVEWAVLSEGVGAEDILHLMVEGP